MTAYPHAWSPHQVARRGVGAVLSGRVSVARDYNGDGASDITVFRSSTGTWYIRKVGSYGFGRPGDTAL